MNCTLWPLRYLTWFQASLRVSVHPDFVQVMSDPFVRYSRILPSWIGLFDFVVRSILDLLLIINFLMFNARIFTLSWHQLLTSHDVSEKSLLRQESALNHITGLIIIAEIS